MWRSVKATLKSETADLCIFPDSLTWNEGQVEIPISSIATLHEGTSLPDKILLKITPKPGSNLDPSGFLFNFALEGVQVRNEVKEFLVTQIAIAATQRPQAKEPIQPVKPSQLPEKQAANHSQSAPLSRQEIACRVNLLSENPQLARLHRSLVRARGLSEEEFWSQRSALLADASNLLKQKRGIPAIALDSTASSKKITLTPQTIQAIFAQFPAVHQAYLQAVPEKTSEREFWAKFFTSKNLLSSGNSGNKDALMRQFNEQSENILRSQLGNAVKVKASVEDKAALPTTVQSIEKVHEFHAESTDSTHAKITKENFIQQMDLHFTQHQQPSESSQKAVKELSAQEANSAALIFEYQRHIWSGSSRKRELVQKMQEIGNVSLLNKSIERAKWKAELE
jgi:hypothetical protein